MSEVAARKRSQPDAQTLDLERVEADETVDAEPGREVPPDPHDVPDSLSARRDRRADRHRRERIAHYERRRKWIARGIVGTAIAANATIALQLHNGVFMDEAEYIASGHLELDHLLHGVPETLGFDQYFSGVPALYPVLSALLDSAGGLVLVRLFSLLCTAGTIALLYSLTRRLFNERTACCAIAVYAVVEPTIFLANFATFDAPVLFLLALALWIVVASARKRGAWYLFAVPALGLAIGFKYFAAVFLLPTVAVAGIAAAAYMGRRALWRAPVLLLSTLAVVGGAFAAGGSAFVRGALNNLTRVHGTVPAKHILDVSGRWAGAAAALAVIGAVAYAVRARTEESLADAELDPGLRIRIALGVVLAGTAFLPAISALRIHSTESLNRHVGYGLLFAAPMVGVGLARIIGDHFRRIQIGIAVWVALLVFGTQQAQAQYGTWQGVTSLDAVLSAYYHHGTKVLVDVSDPEIYELHAWDDWTNWTDGFGLKTTGEDGKALYGDAAYRQAVLAGDFDLIAADRSNVTTMSFAKLQAAISDSHRYRLIAVLPSDHHWAPYYVWAKMSRQG